MADEAAASPVDKRVALDGLALALVARPSDLTWLEEHYAFEAIAPTDAPSIRVALAVDPARLAAARAGGDRAFAQSTLNTPSPWVHDGARCAFDRELDALYILRERTIEVVAAAGGTGRIAWLRAIRDLHERRLAADGAMLLDAAAFALGEDVVLIAGPRTAERTTLLTWFIAPGGAIDVSNHRTALLPDGRAVGIPDVMTFGPVVPDHMTVRRRRESRVIAVLWPEESREPAAEPMLEPLAWPEAERHLREARIPIAADGFFAELVPSADVIAPPPLLAFRCRLGADPSRATRLVERLRELAAWQEEESADFRGWDFSRLDGRMTMADPPWSFEAKARAAIASAHTVLDVGTGGGETLAALLALAPTAARIVASERHRPNVAIAHARLEPLGVAVVGASPSKLPFREAHFDLVLDRHARFSAAEIARVLAPGGRFLTQQIDPATYTARRLMFGREPTPPRDDLAELTAACRDAGLVVEDAQSAEVSRTFADVGALVYHQRAVPWSVPDFSVAGDLEVLWRLADRDEPLEFPVRFSFICASKPRP